MERILACGDRNWTDRELIAKILGYFVGHGFVLIHGAARGADTIAAEVGKQIGMRVIPFPAQWTKYGKRAGLIRNQQMLDEGKPTCYLAFHDDIEHSKGTKDMVTRCKKAGLPGQVISHT